MCGVAAIVSRDASTVADGLRKMVSVMHHRGPDDDGTYMTAVTSESQLGLGHNRLSIIDLTANASQPMRSADGRYVLVYNGEIYNYKEIAADLPEHATKRDLRSDTAVVLAALECWGPSAFRRFNGMWAIILYDSFSKTLLVSRDRLGIKPLYSYSDGQRLVFSSEIKAVLSSCNQRFPVNPDVAVPYLTRGLRNTSRQTFFSGIEEFPPASYAVIDLTRIPTRLPQAQRYWHHPFELNGGGEHSEVTPTELRAIFVDAVNLRMRSDVPVGVLLSGGLDSSAIVGALDDTALSNVTVLSVTSDDPRSNEEAYIDRMAEWRSFVPAKVNVSRSAGDLLARVGKACWFNDAPVASMSNIAHMRLMELARERGIKVILTGQGADEQLGGYSKFVFFFLQSLLRSHQYWRACKTVAQFAMHSSLLYELQVAEARRYIAKRKLSTRTFIRSQYQDRDVLEIGSRGTYAEREWQDLVATSVPALLHSEDRMSMAHSVEVRVPFLDYRLVEALAVVDPREKFAGGRTKSIFRKAISGMVPPEIQYRRDKRGFTVPETPWMRNEFTNEMTRVFDSAMLAEAIGIIERPRLKRLYAEFVRGDNFLTGKHFFRAYAFETFLREFSHHVAV